MKLHLKSFTAGLIVMAFIAAGTVAFASDSVDIKAYFGRIKLFVNNIQVQEETLLYNGTTYVPIRAAANALNMEVAWDDETSTAYIDPQGTFRVFGEAPVIDEVDEKPLEDNEKPENMSLSDEGDKQELPDAKPEPEESPEPTNESVQKASDEIVYYNQFNNIPDFGWLLEADAINVETNDDSDMLEYKISYPLPDSIEDSIKDYGLLLEKEGFLTTPDANEGTYYYFRDQSYLLIVINKATDQVDVYIFDK